MHGGMWLFRAENNITPSCILIMSLRSKRCISEFFAKGGTRMCCVEASHIEASRISPALNRF